MYRTPRSKSAMFLYGRPRTGFDGVCASVATVMKWYGVVVEASKYRPSIDWIRPLVQYGSSISASGVPYAPIESPPSHSMRPGASLFAVSRKARYSGHDFAVDAAWVPPS